MISTNKVVTYSTVLNIHRASSGSGCCLELTLVICGWQAIQSKYFTSLADRKPSKDFVMISKYCSKGLEGSKASALNTT